tara:strand:- start:263 stop:1216 length:954 start_codon:yes stop_codon:yes gene_type:complete
MNQENKIYDDAIDVKGLAVAIWSSKTFIIFLTLISSVVGVTYSLALPNKYISSSLLSPVSQQGVNNSLGSASSLASMAGISIPMESQNKLQMSIEILESKDFFQEFYDDEEFLIELMAAKSFNSNTKVLNIDSEIYDVSAAKWVRVSPLGPKPTLLEAHKVFKKIFTISLDKETSFTQISIEHISPETAFNMVSRVINSINLNMRTQDAEEAKISLNYLYAELEKNNISSTKLAITALIEEEIKNLMLAEVTKDYVFKIIDSPRMPELKSSPSRAAICIIFFIFGFIFSSFTVIALFVADKRIVLGFLPPKIKIQEI